jgi:hypothetical protein
MIASRWVCGQPARHDHAVRSRRLDLVRDLPVLTDAAAARELHAVLDGEPLGEGLDAEVDAMSVVGGSDREVGGLPVHEQGIGQDVVRAPELAVEVLGALVRGAEAGLVDDDVALDRAQSRLPQVVDEAPPTLDGQQRVAAALEVEVAFQHALDDRGIGEGPGLPGVGRAEQVQRRPGRQQLHRRGRRARHARIQFEQALAAGDVTHDDADAGLGHRLAGQGRTRCGRQRVRGGGRRDERRQRDDRQPESHLMQY